MSRFNPLKIYYEKEIEKYELGRNLLLKYNDIPKVIIEKYEDIEEIKKNPDKHFGYVKKTLVLGVKKFVEFIPKEEGSNYIVPFTSSVYEYLRIFVNREEIVRELIKKTNISDGNEVYDIGSDTDLILENEITNNLPYILDEFSKTDRCQITFQTKFHMVDSILNLNKIVKDRTTIKMCVSPSYIIEKIEKLTSTLGARIDAINKLAEAGYKVGITVVPVIMLEGYKEKYLEMFSQLRDGLSEKAKSMLFFEVYFMSFSDMQEEVYKEAFAKYPAIFAEENFKKSFAGVHTYKDPILKEGKEYIKLLLNIYFPRSEVTKME